MSLHWKHKKTAWSDPKFVQTHPDGSGYAIQERRCMNRKCNKWWRRKVLLE